MSAQNLSIIPVERDRVIMIQAIRLGFLFVILAVTILFQSVQPEFLNPGLWIPFYLILGFSFLINSLFLIFFDRVSHYWYSNAFIFGYDALVITSLIYLTGISQSIFLFLYLVNIILCGLVYQRAGALALALWTSTLFSFLLIIGPELQGQSLYFAIGLNNLAFFSVALLSGYLSEQINFMGTALTERGRQIGELQDLNELIVENVGTGMMTLNPGRVIEFANPSGKKILDVEEELKGLELVDVLPEVDEWMKLVRFRDRPMRTAFMEKEIETKSHGKIALEITASMLVGSDDQLRGYVLLFHDRTEIKRLEYAVRQQEKLAAVGQLAAGIAHEIRNPLASISGSIQLLVTDDSVSMDERARLMKIILKEIDRLNNLITEFLDYVRPGVRVEDPIQINQVVSEVLEMIRFNKSLRPDVEVIQQLNSKLILLGHRDKLKQALLNILINAYQAMEKSQRPMVEVKTWDEGESVKLSIRDHGQGISEQNLTRIFEPFHTTKPRGTGLGLAVTHKILEDHGARIFVESQVGRGTVFVIEFIGGRGRVEENRKLA